MRIEQTSQKFPLFIPWKGNLQEDWSNEEFVGIRITFTVQY
jgi:hypothetical protein